MSTNLLYDLSNSKVCPVELAIWFVKCYMICQIVRCVQYLLYDLSNKKVCPVELAMICQVVWYMSNSKVCPVELAIWFVK